MSRLDDSMNALIGPESVLTVRLAPDARPEQQLLHRFLSWTGAVQRHCKIPVSEKYHAQQRRSQMTAAVFDVTLPAVNYQATAIAISWVARLINQILNSQVQLGSLDERLHALDDIKNRLAKFVEPGLNKFSIVHAANRLDIPVTTLASQVHQLGTGCRARWMNSTITDQTPSISVALARNKMETASVLKVAGLPGPTHLRVQSPQAAVEAAHKLGFPVVVKPADLDQGVGVAADLRDDQMVVDAYTEAAKVSQKILVEKWFDGFTHRLTVIDGRVIRVSKRIAGGVVGDGQQSIADLVADMQRQEEYQRRLRRLGKPLLNLDDEALGLLAQNDLNSSHVPAAGEYIRLRRRDNVNAGGTSKVCPLEAVHPDNIRLAIDAAALMRLDFAGVDLIIQDISRSWMDIGGLICEVNAQPQVVAPEQPGLYEDILKRMFAGGARIPAHLVVCPKNTAGRDAIIQRWIHTQGCNGVSDQTGLWINGVKATPSFNNSLLASRALFVRPDITGAVCLMTLEDIAERGLPVNRWDSITMAQESPLQAQEKQLLGVVNSMLFASAPIRTALQPSAQL